MAYTPIKIDEEFNKKAFLDESKNIQGIRNSLETLLQDPTNPSAIGNLGGIMHNSPQFYLNQDNSGIMARAEAEFTYKGAQSNLEKYVKKNADSVYSMLNIEKKAILLQNAKLQKAEDKEENKAYNEFVKLKGEADRLEEAMREAKTDPRKKIAYLAEKMKTEPQWAQEMMNLFGGNNKYLDAILMEYAQINNQEMSKILYNKDGKPNSKVINYLADKSLALAKGAKEDNGYFSALAEIAPIENKKKTE